jgi:pSer/pThr/pTyr-binding forkhead associated (FHA) protein
MLKIRFKNNKYNAVWLVEPLISIGRSATNDLVLDNDFVADRHVEVHVSHETLTLKNLQPLKPVKINNIEITGACTLKEDDEISIGDIELVVIDPKRESKIVTPEAINPTQLRAIPNSGWALKANHAALSNRVFPLKDITVIGRASECDITLSAAHLSRRHAQLQITDGALFVKDLGSANGTFLNGKQVVEARVKRGDELRFDTLTFGVMGPADELAKTTVRLVVAAENQDEIKHAAKDVAKTHSIPVAKKESSHYSPYAYSYSRKKEDTNTFAGKLVFVVFVVLVLAVAAVVFKGKLL